MLGVGVVLVAALAQPAPLVVTVDRPVDGARIKAEDLGPDNTYPVAGRLSGGSEPFVVTVNGSRASVSPGPRFARDTRLRGGANTLTVKATDGSGASVTKTVKVTVTTTSAGDPSQSPNRWPVKPVTRKRCAAPAVGFGRVRSLRVARITCSRAATVVRATLRDRGRACSPNPADGAFSRCMASGFRCYSRNRGARTQQYACVKGRAAARWYLDF